VEINHHLILKLLRNFDEKFQKNELATILFRKKSEHLFRDKLTYLLIDEILQNGQSSKLIPIPEWNSKKWADNRSGYSNTIDIAILKEKVDADNYFKHNFIPSTLIEIKNASSPFILGFGNKDNIWEFKNGGGLLKDITGMAKLAETHLSITNYHAILAVNCPRKPRPEKYRYIVSEDIEFRSLNKMMSHYKEEKYTKVIEDVMRKLSETAQKMNAKDISFITITGGKAFENEIDVLFMLLSF